MTEFHAKHLVFSVLTVGFEQLHKPVDETHKHPKMMADYLILAALCSDLLVNKSVIPCVRVVPAWQEEYIVLTAS